MPYHSDIEAILEGEPFQLIESVAEAVANTILRRHPLVHTAVIRIDKPHAPIDGDFGTVGDSHDLRAALRCQY